MMFFEPRDQGDGVAGGKPTARSRGLFVLAMWIWVVTGASCTNRAALPFRVEGVTPAAGWADETTPVTIRGRFAPVVRLSYADRSRSKIDANFKAWAGSVALQEVVYRDRYSLTAVIPAGLAPGFHDLVVENPAGSALTLPASIEIHAAGDCREDFDCQTPCYPIARCVDRRCELGSPTRDGDGDGAVDAACGGSDCDDANPLCRSLDCTDGDGDGVCRDMDCDDAAGTGASCYQAEACVVVFPDQDGDGFGSDDPNLARTICQGSDPGGYVSVAGDCADLAIGDPNCGDQSGALCVPGGVEGVFGDARCADGSDNDCDGAKDGADVDCTHSVPPRASVVVSPITGDTTTTFTFDGSASADVPDTLAQLTFLWSDPQDGPHGTVQVAHGFSNPGLYPVSLLVADSEGLVGWAERQVAVSEPGTALIVSTAQDEEDPGATADAPLGNGLSFREALLIANSRPGRDTIVLAAVPNGYRLTGGALPTPLGADGLTVVGDGAAVRGGNLAAGIDCWQIDADDVVVMGLRFENCPDHAIEVTGGANVRLIDNVVVGGGAGFRLTGFGHQVGPGNLVDSVAGIGVEVVRVTDTASPIVIRENVIRGTGAAGLWIAQQADQVLVVGNVIVETGTGGTTAATQLGVALEGGLARLYHNLVADAAGTGIWIRNNALGISMVNNIVFRNGQFGLDPDEQPASFETNIFFANGGTACDQCQQWGSNLETDPKFFDPAGDYRLRRGSPAIDGGTPVTQDRNGPGTGEFYGTAPDIGAHEWPEP